MNNSTNKRLGFIILSINKIDNQFIKLLDRLREFKNSAIAIHHDSTLGYEFPKEIAEQYGIILVTPSYKTYWSHLNNVYATLSGLTQLYQDPKTVDWFITLTPSCYPIKPISEIQSFYNVCQYDALIDLHEVGKSNLFNELDKFILRDFNYQPWFKIPFLSKQGKLYTRTIRKKIKCTPHPFLEIRKPYQGSNWFSINRSIAQLIIDKNLINSDLVLFYKNHIKSLPNMHPCPQETILQTFIGNLEHIRINFNNYRYINWENCNGWSPNILTATHWDELKISDAHWARKFQNEKSEELISKIDHECSFK